MVRQVMTLWWSAVGALAVSVTLAGGVGIAAAAPKPAPRPTTIQVVGAGLDGPLMVQQNNHNRLFDTLLSEVSWMTNARSQTGTPRAEKLGPKYVFTVLVKTTPVQVYDLYPLAAGGPRAHRPTNQPSGKKTEGWFYGRLTMAASLQAGGVPLNTKPDVVGGGIGGGIGEDIDDDPSTELDPVAQMDEFVHQMRSVLLLNGAILVVILGGLASFAYVVRRKV